MNLTISHSNRSEAVKASVSNIIRMYQNEKDPAKKAIIAADINTLSDKLERMKADAICNYQSTRQ